MLQSHTVLECSSGRHLRKLTLYAFHAIANDRKCSLLRAHIRREKSDTTTTNVATEIVGMVKITARLTAVFVGSMPTKCPNLELLQQAFQTFAVFIRVVLQPSLHIKSAILK